MCPIYEVKDSTTSLAMFQYWITPTVKNVFLMLKWNFLYEHASQVHTFFFIFNFFLYISGFLSSTFIEILNTGPECFYLKRAP